MKAIFLDMNVKKKRPEKDIGKEDGKDGYPACKKNVRVLKWVYYGKQ